MSWIAENPQYDSDDTRLLKYLSKRIGPQDANKVVKVLNLYKYIRTHPFHSAQDIQTSAYYDNAKKNPVFTRKQAKSLLGLMKQSGGAGDDAILLDRAIRYMITFIQGYIPYPITNVANTAYQYATILKTFETMPGVGPFVDIGKEAFVQGTKTLVVGANDVATDIGGPAGSVVVAVPAAIATFGVVMAHLLEDELGEALLVSFLAVPFIGPTLYKAAGSLGKFGRKVFEHRDAIVGVTRTFLGDTLANDLDFYIPRMGGKRFSTRRHRKHKWIRTKSVRR